MDIHELINRSGFTRRTIYYYTQIGLLPPPEGKGKNFRYSEEHLQRLLLIRKLQKARYSLKEIQQLLNQKDLSEELPTLMQAPEREFNLEMVQEAKTPPAVPRQTLIRVELADGLELLIAWPLTPQSRRYLKHHLPDVYRALEG